MAPALLTLRDIHLSFGGAPLLDGAELAVAEGERLCLVGRNGSGKSTLMKIAAGLMEPDRGSRIARPSATIRYLPQEPDLSGFATTLAFVEAGLAPGDERHRASQMLRELGLTGGEVPATLSGGEARRAALARVLAPSPDVLLLDEPTNHLDLPAIEWLEGELRSSRSALVLISHDRRFLENLSNATIWLDRGATRRLPRGFGAFEAWRDALLDEEERDRQKLNRKIVAELDWVRYGVTARRKRNQRRMAELAGLRRERREQRRAVGTVRFAPGEAEMSGKLVIEAKGVTKAFDGKPVVAAFSTRIVKGDRVGIVGANGAGKTTLLKLLTGALQPDAGSVALGANLAIVTLDQRRVALDPEATLAELLTAGRGDLVIVGDQARHVVSYMKDFLFAPEQATTPARLLSGGERGRLLLAMALAKPSNLLVLDEPTNDLDLETLDLLQEMVADYPGTVLLVSHDRDFLDHVATSVLMAEGEGRFVEYAGGYTDMVAQRGEGVAARLGEQTPRKVAKAASAPAPRAEPRRKLGFNDRHALATLPDTIAGLSRDIEAINARLADADLHSRDPKTFGSLLADLAEKQAALAAAEERWLELEIAREEIERA